MSGLRSSLPVELTKFVGRKRELASARDLVMAFRLVTFTGVGGSGKTRLALELASLLETDFRGGAAFVELAPLSDPAFIAQAIAQVIGVVESSRRSGEEALVTALRESEILLVLDNCEHLVDECSSLVERLLKACAGLRVLATSRQPLEIPGEVTFPAPPLSIPPLDRLPPLPVLGAFEAVQLFADRAAAARPGFVIDDSNAEVVARICSRLDGLPLAIELAAPRTRSMSVDEILQRLDDRFLLLSQGARTAVPRHKTLRATIDWSHDLLSDDERILFRRLAVFAGGWTLEDAESACSDDSLPRQAIVDVHSRLADKSLIVVEALVASTTRHRFLETIRQYAGERLIGSGEVDLIRRRHFTHFLDLAEQYYKEQMTGGSDSGLLALSAHRDNLRAALAWGAEVDPEGTLRLISALDNFWRMIGPLEGWDWFQRTLNGVPEGNPHRLRALLTAGMLATYISAYAEGAGLLREVLAIAQAAGDPVSEAWAELELGRLAFFGDDIASAEQHLNRALVAHEDLGIPLGRVRSLVLLGVLQSRIPERLEKGVQQLQTAAELAHEIKDSFGEGQAHMMLGICAADGGDAELTRAHCHVALNAASLGPIRGVVLQQLARIAVEEDPARAIRLMGAAAGNFEHTGGVEPGFLRRSAETVPDRAAQLLGADTASHLFEEGRQMSIEEAIAFAIDDSPSAAHPRRGGLSRRELQVAALVGRRQTNRDIARTLFISVRTAESHVEHILAKLSLANRLELATWARGNDPVDEETSP